LIIRLYLETNFLLSHANGRDLATSRLIEGRFSQLQIAIPRCCVMEALTSLEGERRRINNMAGQNQALFGELGRNLVSPHAAELVALLQSSEPVWKAGLEFFEDRLSEAIRWLSDPSLVACLVTNPVNLAGLLLGLGSTNLDPTDHLILTMILDDAQQYTAATKVLLTENRRCFHDNQRVRQSLQQAGIQYFAHASKFLEWYEARAES